MNPSRLSITDRSPGVSLGTTGAIPGAIPGGTPGSTKASFTRWKDLIIPGHVDHWRARELRAANQALSSRDVLLAFHGRSAENAEAGPAQVTYGDHHGDPGDMGFWMFLG